MSKEPEALKVLNEIKDKFFVKDGNNIIGDFGLYRRLSIIEAALKEWQLWKDNLEVGDIETQETKAFEIIKEKRVDTHFLVNCRCLKEYNDFSEFNFCKKLTQEEYDLLKEVLL